MFEGKKILITGGTGSLGKALTRRLLDANVDTIRIFSRNEDKQVMMRSEFKDEKRLRFLVGDVRDLPRLNRAFEDIDIVFHTAALKHVPIIAYNPFEAVKTNVIGSQNIIDASLHEDVEMSIAIGTDKAVSPLNTYGATKLLMEKLFVTANNYLMGLIRYYILTDNMYFHIGGVADYMTISWKDIDRNISGNFNKIVPGTNFGIAVSPFQFEKPFPISVVAIFDIHAILIPNSYSETDGIITFADLQIKLLPGFLFQFSLPLLK